MNALTIWVWSVLGLDYQCSEKKNFVHLEEAHLDVDNPIDIHILMYHHPSYFHFISF